jgi:hypothetical protein
VMSDCHRGLAPCPASVVWFRGRHARRQDVDDDAVLRRDIDAMRGVVRRHNEGSPVDSDRADGAPRPGGQLARLLPGQPDELAGNAFRPPSGRPDHGLKLIDYLLRPRVERGHVAILAAV